MPAILHPNSHGEPLEIEPWNPVREAWSDVARKASAEARRRRKTIDRLKNIRTKALDRMMKQMNYEKGMHQAPLHGLSPKAAAHWHNANKASSHIERLAHFHPTSQRPLLARFKKGIRRYF